MQITPAPRLGKYMPGKTTEKITELKKRHLTGRFFLIGRFETKRNKKR